MVLPEVFSVLAFTTLCPYVIAIGMRAFETGLVFLPLVAQEDLPLRKKFTFEAEITPE
jgi:hypothetical protein